jgi:hypothetical protein
MASNWLRRRTGSIRFLVVGIVRVDASNNICRRGETKLTLYTASGSDQTFLPLQGKATDADTLDGIDSQDLILQCASGMTQGGDICFTDTYDATNWEYAYLGCANSNMRLPSIAEQSLIYRHIYFNTPSEEGWVDELADSSTAFSLKLNNATVNPIAHSFDDSLPYRCVSSPTNQGAAATSAQTIVPQQHEPALKPR